MRHIIPTMARSKEIAERNIPPPIEYETAVNALAACLTIEDSKRWADKADALAAWAKIYRDDKVGRQAKILKLEAYRRMGSLAGELSPVRNDPTKGRVKGTGPIQELMRHGLSREQANSARSLSNLPDRLYDKVLENPRNPIRYRRSLVEGRELVWRDIKKVLSDARYRMRANPVSSFIVPDTEAIKSRALVVEIIEWLDALEMVLAKQAERAHK